MSPRLKEKDTDPHGISASMKLVKDIATLDKFSIYGMPYRTLSEIQRKARRIRKKFRGKGEGD